MNADTLHHLATNYPEAVGHIIYLFIWGELVDAIQNQSISHLERIKMAMCAYYFFNIWAAFLDKAAYPRQRYFMSREAFNIVKMVVNGLVGLIVIYRDYVHHYEGRAPFLPWLHSTEVCEHLFGELHQQITDFTFLNTIYCIPKLGAIMRGILLATKVSRKVRASRYLHTWYDAQHLDLAELSRFPSDEQIQEIAQQSYQEADMLFSQLDIPLPTFLDPRRRLPAVSNLFTAADQGIREGSDRANAKRQFELMCMQLSLLLDSDSDSDSDNNSHDESLAPSPNEEDELEDVLQYVEGMPWADKN